MKIRNWKRFIISLAVLTVVVRFLMSALVHGFVFLCYGQMDLIKKT